MKLVHLARSFSYWFLSGYGGFVWLSEALCGIMVLSLALGGFIMLGRAFTCNDGV